MSKLWDAIVIGAGPAGASCAVWLKQLGFEPLLLEAGPAPGGLLRSNSYLDIWTVISPHQTGQEMANKLARQVEIAGLNMRCRAKVVRVERDGTCFKVDYEVRNDQGLSRRVAERSRHVVVASGVRARAPLNMLNQVYDGVLVGPGEQVMNHDFKGLSVAILGGGDNAFENYIFVKNREAKRVHLYARSVSAQPQFVRQVPDNDLHMGVVDFDPGNRSVNGRTYDRVLIFYGWEPRAQFLEALDVARDERGFLQVDAQTTQTSLAGLYAIGEVNQRMHPCVPTAMADGVIAAKAIERSLHKNEA